MNDPLLQNLNPAQAEAVTAAPGPLLIIAGPGSGKTRVISHRAAWLIGRRHADPRTILAVTFTNKAADEMKERIHNLIPDHRQPPRTATFHAWCAALLRRHGDRIGLAPNYSIFGDEAREAAVKHCLETAGYDPARYRPHDIAQTISETKNRLITPEQAARQADTEYRHVAARIHQAYETLLRRNNAADLDGLITQAAALLTDCPQTLEQIREQCQHLMVDEFQDTNAAQYRLARALAGEHRSLCAVGDPDQSIYAWRHATPENLQYFRQDFPEARTVNLELNYRSPANILDAARTLIAKNPQPQNPNLTAGRQPGRPIVRNRYRDPGEEAEAIVLETLRLARETGLNPAQCAALYRANHQAAPIIEAGLRHGLPCRTPETVKSEHRRTLEDLIPYLKAAANPRDSISLEQIINTPHRGIGPRTLAKLKERARNTDTTLLETLRAAEAARRAGRPDPAGLKPPCAAAVALFHRRLADLIQAAARRPASEAVRAALILAGPDAQSQLAMDLIELAETFDAAAPPEGIRDLLERTALLSSHDRLNPEDGSLNLLTLHQAKGLEFEAVFLPGLEENLLPHYRAAMTGNPKDLEEERRLCFVGITRAKQRLYLSWCARRQNAAGHWTNARPSRFLGEMPVTQLSPAANHPAAAGPRRGDPVWHPKHGLGTIIHTAPNPAAYPIAIRFNGRGSRVIKIKSA